MKQERWIAKDWLSRWALLLLPLACLSAQSKPVDSVLWYRHPAAVWTEALPVGNGRLGAMVFGGANAGSNNGDREDEKYNSAIEDGKSTNPQDEHLQLNESTLWAGSRADRLNPAAHDGFVQVRKLLLDSGGNDSAKISAAEAIAQKTMIAIPPAMPSYATLGDLYLRTDAKGTPSEYRRELNLDSGVVTIKYLLGGTRFTRQIFASEPDHVIVVRLTADHRASISFRATMDRPNDFTVSSIANDLVMTQGAAHKDQIRFQGQVRVLNRGGRIGPNDGTISVEQADEVLLLVAAATDFKGGPISGGDPARMCAAQLDAAAKKTYAQLRDAASGDQRRLMQRVALQLGSGEPSRDNHPTDERLKAVATGRQDLGLEALYFQFARYLLVGSSRPGGLPANLQGLWASGLTNPWGSKWTINVNTEMNYWLAESANLGELETPIFDLLDMLRVPATGTATTVAQKYYGARGFVVHHNTDLWGDSEAIDGVPYGIWPMGGAWLTLDAWDRFAYSGDLKFLRERAWPLLHDASLFFLDYLVDDGHGHLVTGPSVSPENKYKLSDGTAHSLAMAPTMDIEIVRELLLRTLESCAILRSDVDFCHRIETAIAKLPPFKIGRLGQLQEWQEDYEETQPGHRHISHLWALYPGTQITPRETPELARAAQTSLKRRLEHGGGQTGWSRAWVVNYWDHLGQGDKAYESLQVLLKQSTFPNMMDTHPPGVFQIDGNLGGANGMLEAIVQSRWYPDSCSVDLLPALPGAWISGSLSGVRVRGGSQLNLIWHNAKLTLVQWTADQNGTYVLHLPAGQHLRAITQESHAQAVEDRGDEGTIFHVAKGKIYNLSF